MKPDSLLLTITIDNEKLFVALSDTKRLGKFGWANSDLQKIQALAASAEPTELQELLIREPISQAIQKSAISVLHIQMPQELAFLPIEGFQTGGQRWCEKYALSCNLLSSEDIELPVGTYGNTPKERMQVLLTHKLMAQKCASELTDHLTKNGLFDSRNTSIDNATSVLLACSASDAAQHIGSSLASVPEMCVWCPDSTSNKAGFEVGDFIAQFPTCSVLTNNNFSSIEESLVRLTPALSAMGSGMSPYGAIQSVSQQNINKNQSFRLYNREDIPLCSLRSPTHHKTENRTITAMSLDVVGSTKLMQQLGNEQYSEVLAALKERCIQCIVERGGSHGGRAGDDSIMAYFGLPNALANTAVCAMDAALAVRDLLPSLPGHPELRIGIATGRVAVRSGVPYGGVIHLAARLQSYGESKDITVDTSSQWLARKSHEFETCDDSVNFKGIEQPVSPIKLIAHARQEFTGVAFSTSAPFMGRAEEMEQLARYWERVSGGEPLVVCVRGETGIGKSRFVSEFLRKAVSEGGRVLKIRGLSDYQHGVFESIRESIKHGFGVVAGDSQLQVAQRVEGTGLFTGTTARHIAQVSDLLGLTHSESKRESATFKKLSKTDANFRKRLFDSLKEGIESAASDRPLIIMVDDLQWIDPSSREALEYLIDNFHARTGLRCVFLCTERDDHIGDDLPYTNTLLLGRLTPQVAYEFLRTVVGDDVPTETVDLLVARAEGVPLFLEESARLVLEQPMVTYHPGLNVPDSIDSLLMSRLDKLDMSGKYLVQIASAMGRDVQIDFLRSVYALLSDASNLSEFEEKILAFREYGVLGNLTVHGPPRLTFRHEMIRDVAYASMWQRDRITIHAAIAEVLSIDQSQAYSSDPSMIAHHLSLSEQYEPASERWELAARSAADASANKEAIHCLRSALECLDHLPANEAVAKQEMRLQLMLAARLIACEGYGAEEVRLAYERAEALVLRFGEKRDQLKVMLGLESVHILRGELVKAEALAISAVGIAKELPASKFQGPMIIQSEWALANLRFHQGRPRQALKLMDQCLDACHSITHRSFVVQDPEIMCLCYGAWALWERGQSDVAQVQIEKALTIARAREHRFSEGEALGFVASLALFRGEYEAAIESADHAIAVCEQEGFALWLAHAKVIKGRAMALSDHQIAGLQLMEEGYEEWISTGAVITRAFYLSLIAETLLEVGDVDRSSERIGEAHNIISSTGDCYHLAEVLRIQGLLAYAVNRLKEGDALMSKAMDTANTQEKQAFVVKTASAMAKSLASRGRVTEAMSMLEKAVVPMSEGFFTVDYCHARQLLSTWAAYISSSSGATGETENLDANRFLASAND